MCAMWPFKLLLLSLLIISTQTFKVYYGPPKNATLSERPFQTVIVKNDIYKCGATLVSKKCVLTACSCILNDEIHFDGDHNLPDNYTIVSYTRYIRAEQINWAYVADVFIAEGCNPRTNHNDAAVLCARDEMVGFPVDMVKEQTKENVRGIVSGWGISTKGQDNLQPILQRAYMRIISLDECRRLYDGIREVPDTALCAVASDEVRGFCAGDIGGPLTHGEGLIGIAVSTFGCEERKLPGIFTDVAKISKFVEESMQEHQAQGDLNLLK